jgi:hypothetical protein
VERGFTAGLNFLEQGFAAGLNFMERGFGCWLDPLGLSPVLLGQASSAEAFGIGSIPFWPKRVCCREPPLGPRLLAESPLAGLELLG